MLENLAWRFLAQKDWQIALVQYAALLSGGILAALLHRSPDRFSRAPYVALVGLVALGLGLGEGLWLLAGDAMRGRWLGLLIAGWIALVFLCGQVLAGLGQARSRDILGHGWAGILAVVPGLNLWLMVAPGMEPGRTGPLRAVGHAALVLFGVAAMILARVLSAGLSKMVEASVAAAALDPALADRLAVLNLARTPPSQILEDIASSVEVPQREDEGVSLMQVTVDEGVLTYKYLLRERGAAVPSINDLRGQVCSHALMARLPATGARVDFVYTGEDHKGGWAELRRLSVSPIDCGV